MKRLQQAVNSHCHLLLLLAAVVLMYVFVARQQAMQYAGQQLRTAEAARLCADTPSCAMVLHGVSVDSLASNPEAAQSPSGEGGTVAAGDAR